MDFYKTDKEEQVVHPFDLNSSQLYQLKAIFPENQENTRKIKKYD
jgi:hypothetical protein